MYTILRYLGAKVHNFPKNYIFSARLPHAFCRLQSLDSNQFFCLTSNRRYIMTIVQRFSLCLCASLYLCCGIVSAQQPTQQQRFLRFLGQRSVTTGTLLPAVEPFRAGVPTTASLVFAIMDSEGRILKDDSTEAFLRLPDSLAINGSGYDSEPRLWQTDAVTRTFDGTLFGNYRIPAGFARAKSKAGMLEFYGLRIIGKAHPNMILHCTAANTQTTSLTISLIGGYRFGAVIPKLKNGKCAILGTSFGEQGAIPYITVGQPVQFNNPDSSDYNYITLKVVDRWGNGSSFPTTATIQIAGGWPPVDQQRTPTIGNTAMSDGNGIAVFKEFQIFGATSANVRVVVSVSDPFTCWGWLAHDAKGSSQLNCSPPYTISTVTLVPSPAIAIAPVIIYDLYDSLTILSIFFGYTPNRMLSRFTIGKSNADDPRTWFYLQAVDQFGNRVDNGPNAYNGGIATIRIATPEEGLPRSTTSNFQFSASNDPYVRANSQRFAATGTSAVAVNGLYTFNNFTPLGPASRSTTDTVVLTFEDPALQGAQVSHPLLPWLGSIFRPIPPITTATTTFIRTTNVALRSETPDVSITPNPASDALRINFTLPESVPVLMLMEDMLGRAVLRHEEQSAVQGAFATTLDVSRLAQGAYTLHVQCGRERWTRRVVILR